MRQDFRVNALLRMTTKKEIIKFDLGNNEDDYREQLSDVSRFISDKEYEIGNIETKIIKGKNTFYTESIEDYYAIKKIAKDLQRLYKVKMKSRDDIAEQVYQLLKTSSRFGIIRLDIKSFYESISYDDCMDKLSRDNLLSIKSINILKSLHGFISGGLPRGLPISPIMSEIYIRKIEEEIKSINAIYYYARYVDDIFIFCLSDCNEIYKKVDFIFTKYGLSLNKNKEYRKNIDETIYENICEVNKTYFSFDYLGYKYRIGNYTFNGKRVVDVLLSDDKVRKIKTRIIHSILDFGYIKNKKDFDLLYDRICFLSSNYKLPSSKYKTGELRGGVYYSNKLVNNSKVFKEFNLFIRKSLTCNRKSFFGRCVMNVKKNQKEKIFEIDFEKGFLERKMISFDNVRMALIKKCWENKNHKRKR